MKIKLPNGEKMTLDTDISLEDKLKVVKGLVKEWDDIIIDNRQSRNVIYFLDSLANYLVWHKEEEEKNKEDKDILSVKKVEKLHKFKKTSKTINFSDLSKEERVLLFGYDERDGNDE